MIAACRANGILPVDGPFGDISDHENYVAQAKRSATLGMAGKWAIHPSQVKLANEVFTPSEQAIENAKDSLNRKLYESQNNRQLFDAVARKFNLETNINLIEVYDNSHIQGTNSVGALITYGDDGFVKKRYRKFNIKHKKNEQDDYGMMREVLNRRFKRAVQELSLIHI